MQKIYIKNFGPIKEAEIEINRLLVIIGEQATGKSTISKLIYFFKSLGDDLFNQFYKSEREFLDITEDLIIPIREKYYDIFGSTFHLPQFEIRYYFSADKWLLLTLDAETKKLRPEFSSDFMCNDFKNDLRNVKQSIKNVERKIKSTNNLHEQLALEQEKLKLIQELSNLINKAFENKQNDSLYVIAGRNATVGYSALFEKYLFASLQTKIEENRKQAFKTKEQTIDETLLLKFIERVLKVKGLFEKYNNTAGLINSLPDNATNINVLRITEQKMLQILKGKYRIDSFGEKIMHENNKYVYLNNASSGQQEIIRILQDIFIVLYEKQKAFRIIEEPEAHLFPLAQKHIVELFALLINQNTENQIIITTHSPYIITAINNLLFAKRVVDANNEVENEVENIIPSAYHLESSWLSAYSLSKNNTYCENILNDKTGLIKQTYLDSVSDLLGSDFTNLYNLHKQKYANTTR